MPNELLHGCKEVFEIMTGKPVNDIVLRMSIAMHQIMSNVDGSTYTCPVRRKNHSEHARIHVLHFGWVVPDNAIQAVTYLPGEVVMPIDHLGQTILAINKGFRRLQALRWLYEGKSRDEVAALSCFSQRQVLRFIQAFNLAGLDGLIPGRSCGRRRILAKAAVREKILPLFEDPALARQSHWTAVKLHGWIKEHLQIQLGYSTTVRYLHEHDYRLKVPRPWPLDHDDDQRQAFCEKLQRWQNDPNRDLWFGDESGFEGDPRPRRTWTKIGQVRHSPYLGEHIRDNVFGAVRPQDDRRGALLFNLCDSVTFQVFLDTLAEESPPMAGRRAILVPDNASWHKTKSLNWHPFEPEYLPARSPDLNPIERLWLRMKADWFNDWIAKTSAPLQDRIIEALRSLFDQPHILQSHCRPKTHV